MQTANANCTCQNPQNDDFVSDTEPINNKNQRKAKTIITTTTDENLFNYYYAF